MYFARHYVGAFVPGECIPDGILTKEQADWLVSAGAIEEIAPVKAVASEDTPAPEESKKTARKRKGAKKNESADAEIE